MSGVHKIKLSVVKNVNAYRYMSNKVRHCIGSRYTIMYSDLHVMVC
jgi:hypothetical protein